MVLNIKADGVHDYQESLGGYKRLVLKYRPLPVKFHRRNLVPSQHTVWRKRKDMISYMVREC
jgi:hypothetical protein